MTDKSYTPPLGQDALTPLYDMAIRCLTREHVWRSALVRQAAPSPYDRILDVGCGTGTLALALKRLEPEADIIGLDPDSRALANARNKAVSAGQAITFVQGFLGDTGLPEGWKPTKIVSSLMFHQVPLAAKTDILSTMRRMLDIGGEIHIADYGLQRDALMRGLFRITVQLLDGVTDTQPNADGVLSRLMREAGLEAEETQAFKTATGSISLFRAAPTEKFQKDI
jgi:ubiquinone/menaquinone biosynthesis C-methylase UbiE